MFLGIKKRQRAPPGATKDMPSVNAKVLTQTLNVRDQVLRRVARQLANWTRPTTATLVKQHDPKVLRVKKPAIGLSSPRAWTTVQKQHRLSFRITALLPIQDMRRVDLEFTRNERLNRRVKMFCSHSESVAILPTNATLLSYPVRYSQYELYTSQ